MIIYKSLKKIYKSLDLQIIIYDNLQIIIYDNLQIIIYDNLQIFEKDLQIFRFTNYHL
jgi:hypothetical protein